MRTTDRTVTTQLNAAPSGGLVVTSHGSYGSAVFDPMDGGATHLELYVCDLCLAAKAASVFHVTCGAMRRDNAYERLDAWLRARRRHAP